MTSNLRNKKKEGQVAKDYVIDADELNLLLKNTSGKDKLIVVAAGLCGMREGEIIHMRKSWLHTDDSKAERYKKHIQIPASNQICYCMDCQLRAYRKYRRDNDKTFNDTVDDDKKIKFNKEWSLKVSHDFYLLPTRTIKKTKHVNGKLRHIFFDCRVRNNKEGLYLEPFWKPKSKKSARRLSIEYKVIEDTFTKFFSKHTKLNMNRIELWNRIKQLGILYLDGKTLYPHALRASFATMLGESKLEDGSRITPHQLQKQLGHASITSSEHYIKVDEEQALSVSHDIIKQEMTKIKNKKKNKE